MLQEPGLCEDSVLIVVNHLALGRKERFFFSNEKCESIYNWIGSLSLEPELFTLRSTFPGNVISPNAFVSTADRQVLMMEQSDTSDFSLDIVDTREFTTTCNATVDTNNLNVTECEINTFGNDEVERFFDSHQHLSDPADESVSDPAPCIDCITPFIEEANNRYKSIDKKGVVKHIIAQRNTFKAKL